MNKKRKNILVIGSGGREHAIVWKVKKSPLAGEVFCLPGNSGISRDASPAGIPLDFERVKSFTEEKDIDLIIVGPEAPLVEGFADFFKESRVMVFGPVKDGAMLEGSKVYAKDFMKKNGIPTAGYEVFDNESDAQDYLSSKKEDVVIKADGLCGGKGVIIPETPRKAREAVRVLMKEKKFGEAGSKIIIEDKLQGEEASVLVMISGEKYVYLSPSQDHKPVFDGDNGPNTGGMGAYAPTSAISSSVMEKIDRKITKPVIDGLKERGIDYRGVLYLGLMIHSEEPGVLEFNVRLGDPEAQAVLGLMESDFLEAVLDLMENRKPDIKWKDGYVVDVVLASGGYPGSYRKGMEISMGDIDEDIMLFHSGTRERDGVLYTDGGRVLNVAAAGKDIERAREKVYGAIEKINFEGMHYRTDIGLKEVMRK